MARPTDELPEWATTGDVVEPSGSKKTLGWVSGELPPHEWFNWLARRTYQWLSYLSDLTNGSDGDWRLIHLRTTDNEPALAVHGQPVGEFKLVWEARAQSHAFGRARCYVSKSARSLVFTVNATWNTSTNLWQLIDSASSAVGLAFTTGTGLVVWSKDASSSPWAADAWDGATSNLFTDGSVAADTLVAAVSTATDDLDVTGTADVATLEAATATVENNLFLRNTVNFAYTGGTRTVTKYADVRSGRATNADFVYTAAPGTAACTIRGSGGGGTTFDVPLNVPSGTTVTQVRALMTSPGSETVSVEVFREVQNFGVPAASKVSLRSGGAVSASGSGSDVTITFTPDQNQSISGTQQCFARVVLAVDAYVYPQLEVQYTTTNPRHF